VTQLELSQHRFSTGLELNRVTKIVTRVDSLTRVTLSLFFNLDSY